MKEKRFSEKYSDFLSYSTMRIILLAVGFLMARSVLFGEYLPFGLAVVAGTPTNLIIYSSIGAIAGYFFPVTGYGMFRYVTAIVAIAGLKIMSSKLKISRYPTFCAIVAFVCSLVLSLTSEITVGADITGIVKCFAESLICCACAYFSSVAIHFLNSPKTKHKPSITDTVCIVAFVGMCLMCFYNIGFSGVSVARVMSVILILCACYYGGIASGAISGATLGFFMFIASGDYSCVGSYAVAGVVGGVFAQGGIVATALSFMLTVILGVLVNDNSALTITVFELLISTTVFLLMPKPAQKALSDLFSPSPEFQRLDLFNKGASMRLNFAAQALSDMGETVENVAQRLKQVNTPEYKEIFDYARNMTCEKCGFLKLCWVHKREDTLLSLSQVSNKPLTVDKLSDNMRERCDKAQQLCDCINSAYSVFSSKREAQARLDEVRGVLIDQFGGISDMLSEMAMDFEKSQRYDYSAAQKISVALSNNGIISSDISCSVDEFDRMSVEIMLRNSHSVINGKEILDIICSVCDRDFDVPCITKSSNDTLISLSEKAIFAIDSAVFSINSLNNKMCGDSAQFFSDGKGRQIMLLSDGMGTGGRAAVDGAMASGLMSKLIKAGFGYDCSMRMVNSAMLFKSTDESLATLDITAIDLYTGKTELYKAGACPTVIKKAGKSSKAECASLPIGIINDTVFDTAKVNLGIGDIVVMMSDGATYDGTDWVCEQLNMIKHPITANDLAQRLATLAKRRRSDGHDDDITVMVSILEKAV